MNTMKLIAATSLCIGATAAFGQHPGHAATPYAGLQSRDIKALSAQDTEGLLQGRGMSLALAAELNGYPGPMHVLELADALQLDAGQRERTQSLLAAHKAEARDMGLRIVEAERELDRAFAGGKATDEEIERLTARIAALQAGLRAAHLQTHLKQTRMLSPHQVMRYQQLRGYTPAHNTHQGEAR